MKQKILWLILLMLFFSSCTTRKKYSFDSFVFTLPVDNKFVETIDERFSNETPDWLVDNVALVDEANNIFIGLLEYNLNEETSPMFNYNYNDVVETIKKELIDTYYSVIENIYSSNNIIIFKAKKYEVNETSFQKYYGVYFKDNRCQSILVQLNQEEAIENEKWIITFLKNYSIE